MQLQEIFDVIKSVRQVAILEGSTEAFEQEYGRKLADLRDKICSEKGIEEEEIQRLPAHTEFVSEELEQSFTALKAWLSDQHEVFQFQ